MVKKILKFIYGNDRNSLISDEGVDILNNPKKRKNIHALVDNWKKNKVWDFKILDKP